MLEKMILFNLWIWTVGTFSVGKTIEFPPILKNFVSPDEFLSEEDSYELDRLFGDFYKHLLSIGILPDMVKDKQKKLRMSL